MSSVILKHWCIFELVTSMFLTTPNVSYYIECHNVTSDVFAWAGHGMGNADMAILWWNTGKYFCVIQAI